MHKIKLVLILSLVFSSSLFADDNKSINISDAWINEAPPTVSALAAYATIHNSTDEDRVLISINSSSFSKIELHLSKIVNEMAKMEKQDTLTIPANSSIEFSPGAYHLMLFDPERSLKAGDKVKIEFNFSDGTTSVTEAIVKKQNMTGHKHQHHHNH